MGTKFPRKNHVRAEEFCLACCGCIENLWASNWPPPPLPQLSPPLMVANWGGGANAFFLLFLVLAKCAFFCVFLHFFFVFASP